MKKHLLLALLFLAIIGFAQKEKPNYKDQWQFPAKDRSMYVTANQQKELYATEAEMKWFKDAKLGIFVHWGPALLKTNVLRNMPSHFGREFFIKTRDNNGSWNNTHTGITNG